MDGVNDARLDACHWLLLRLAGIAADDLIAQCRQWLGRGRVLDVGRAVAHAVLAQRLRLKECDVDLLAELLAADGADASALSLVEVTDLDPMPIVGFAPSRDLAGVKTGVAADGRPDATTAAAPEDELDRVAIAAAGDHVPGRAVWRAWRFPGDGAPWPPPKRVYVVETHATTGLAKVAADLQTALSAVGESHPQVEVYPTESVPAGRDAWRSGELPSYQRLARAFGGLLWAREPDPGVRVADLFDAAGGTAPRRSPRHPVLAEPEVGRLLSYLGQGAALLVTTARTDDVVDAAVGPAVPMNVRTDGFWIWSEATSYYLRRYGFAPDPDLLDHIRARGYTFSSIDGAALYRALAVLQPPDSNQPAWIYGG